MSEIAFWFRRDLRFDDNCGLFHAIQQNQPLHLFFIFDPNILNTLSRDDHRVSLIWNRLSDLQTQLQSVSNKLNIIFGPPIDVWRSILIENPQIKSIYCNHDYEPYASARDNAVAMLCKSFQVQFHSFKDQVIFEKFEIMTESNQIYKVYTPFKKKWLATLQPQHYKSYSSSIERIAKLPTSSEIKLEQTANSSIQIIKSLNDFGFKSSPLVPLPINYNQQTLVHYSENRNNLAIENGTTRLGTVLRFGFISIRKCVQNALMLKADTWLSELIWREFFMQILFHFSDTVTKPFRHEFSFINYRNDLNDFERWCHGETGYPIIDAGMRELNQTGYMHNRARMITASFLTKHLLLPWQWGERYFAKKLFDFDLSANVGNWQWVAGCGVDAAPYFRIFNPNLQTQKFDPQFIYIRKWLPEFGTARYPKPIIDHNYARKRALVTFNQALKHRSTV